LRFFIDGRFLSKLNKHFENNGYLQYDFSTPNDIIKSANKYIFLSKEGFINSLLLNDKKEGEKT